MDNPKTVLGWCIAAILLSTDPANLPAQTSASNTEGKPADSSPNTNVGETIVLTPFSVQSKRDYGYRATNSITATGIGTEISLVPMAINVLTSDFLQDKGSINLKDVLDAIPGVTSNGRHDLGGQYNVRGFPVVPQVNGFELPGALTSAGNSFGVERIEVLKGPASVFNGITPPGGTINIVLKKASYNSKSYIEGKYGSDQFGSVELYSTGPLIKDKLAYVLDGMVQDSSGWQKWTGTHHKNILIGAVFSPVKAVNLSVTYTSYSNHDQWAGIRSLLWTHTGYVHAGLAQNSASNLLSAWVQRTYGAYEPWYDSLATPFPGGVTYNVGGPQNYLKISGYIFSRDLTVQINDHLTVRGAYFDAATENQSVAANFNSGVSPDPAYTAPFNARLQAAHSRTEGRTGKIEAALKLETGPIRHQILAGYEDRKSEAWSNGRNGESLIPLQAAGLPFWNASTDGLLMVQDLFNKLDPAHKYSVLYGPAVTLVKAPYLAEQAEMFQGRFRIMAGIRSTSLETYADNAPRRVKVTKSTPQVGFLIRPFPQTSRLKDTSLFANYSKSFEPAGVVDAFGTIVPPSSGVGKEIGLKTEWWDGKLSGTLSYFEDARSDMFQRDFQRENDTGKIPLYNLGITQAAKGAEVDVLWTPSHQLQLQAGYTWLPFAKITATSTPQDLGRRIYGMPKKRATLTAKYTFVTGMLNGVYLGTSIVASSTLYPSNIYDWHSGYTAAGYVQADAFVGYQTKANGRTVTFSVNVKNVGDRGGFIYDADTPSPPRSWFITTRVEF